MGFRVLRVINEDRIQGGTGFSTHGHRDMEIITYVVEGALEHKDTMGNTAVIRPGEVQIMSAGTGVRHSEFNHLPDQECHLFQIWILPDREGHAPGYGQKSFAAEIARNELVKVVSGDGGQGSLAIHQDANLYVARLKKGQALKLPLSRERYGWLQMIRGHLMVDDVKLLSSDGLAIRQEEAPSVVAKEESEILFFDLP